MSAREEILGRVRTALTDVRAAEPPLTDARAAEPPHWDKGDPEAAYRRSGPEDRAALLELFAQRCDDYRATVTRCDEASIAAVIRDACARHQVGSLVVPPGLDPAWVPPDVSVVHDEPPLSASRLDGVDAVLSGCALAIALTGTIALDGRSGQGRRALTLVPDVHVCVVLAEQIVYGVPEAVQALGESVRSAHRPLTLISGPSATSDIELQRVEGVHGPRELEVVVAG